MKLVLILLAFPFLSTAAAESTKATPKTLPAPADVCKELAAGAPKCAAGAKLKTKLGAVTVYRVDGDQVRIAMAIDTGKEVVLSPAFEQATSDCGAGKCQDLNKATPKLVELKVGGTDAVALDVTAAMSRTYNEGKKATISWTTRTFVVCGKGTKGWGCVTTSVGAQDAPCTSVALSKDGELKSTCTVAEHLAL